MTHHIIIIGWVSLVGAPLLYLQYRVSKWAIETERAAYDDSDCEPGKTNYPGPM